MERHDAPSRVVRIEEGDLLERESAVGVVGRSGVVEARLEVRADLQLV
jgi:hypothetical protein